MCGTSTTEKVEKDSIKLQVQNILRVIAGVTSVVLKLAMRSGLTG